MEFRTASLKILMKPNHVTPSCSHITEWRGSTLTERVQSYVRDVVKYIKSGNKGEIVMLLLSYPKRIEAKADDGQKLAEKFMRL